MLDVAEKLSFQMISFSIVPNVYYILYKKIKFFWDMSLADALTDWKK